MRPSIRKTLAATASVFAMLAMAACGQDAGPADDGGGDGLADTVTFGVVGPKTGDQAQYGEDWQKGFDLALEELNAEGDIEYKIDFQDSQGQPAQASNIAQKFVSDDSIIAAMGDFSSATSMVASPVFQRGGMVQLGITNSHPDFTTTGWPETGSLPSSLSGGAAAARPRCLGCAWILSASSRPIVSSWSSLVSERESVPFFR